MKNSPDNLFRAIPVGQDETTHLARFLDDHDLAAASRKAIVSDLRKFAAWFAAANKEPFVLKRVTVRDITDFREHLRREKGQAVTVGEAEYPALLIDDWHDSPALTRSRRP